MSQYNELLSELATRRADLATTKANKGRLLAEFEATAEYSANSKVQKLSTERIEELEKEIKTIGLAWVKTNLADALVYDEKKVKSYATKIGAVDGIEITEEPQAQIASVL